MNILLCGFKGNTNSAKLIVEKIACKCSSSKLYLVNSFETSKKQLESTLENTIYDYIIAFGQKPYTKSIFLEQSARINNDTLMFNYKYDKLERILTTCGFTVNLSNNAGDYLCNHIFYFGLSYIKEKNLNTKMMFIHIPKLKDINDIDYLANVFSSYIDNLPN